MKNEIKEGALIISAPDRRTLDDRRAALELFALGLLKEEITVSVFDGSSDSRRCVLTAKCDLVQSAELGQKTGFWSIAAVQVDGPRIVVATKDRSPLADVFALQSLVALLACHQVTEIWLYWREKGMIGDETFITIYRIDRQWEDICLTTGG